MTNRNGQATRKYQLVRDIGQTQFIDDSLDLAGQMATISQIGKWAGTNSEWVR